MSKYEFLGDLSRLLSDISEDERKQALKYYEDYFADAGDEHEQDVLRELGTPEEIARQIKEPSPDNVEYGDSAMTGSQNQVQKYDAAQQEQGETTSDNQWQSRNGAYHDSRQQAGSTSGSGQAKAERDNGKIILIILLAIILSPLWGTGLVGVCSVILGIFSAALGLLAALILGGGGVCVGGVFCIFGGIAATVTGEVGAGILTIGVGCIMFSVGAMLCYLGVMLCIKLIPALCKETGKFFQWCSSKINHLINN